MTQRAWRQSVCLADGICQTAGLRSLDTECIAAGVIVNADLNRFSGFCHVIIIEDNHV